MKKLFTITLLLFAFTQINAQGWTQLTLGTNANFQDICVSMTDNNYVYVAGEDKIFKSTDAGDTWTELSQSITTTLWGITFPTNNIGYACSTDGYIIKTTDGGNNWVSLGQIASGFDRIVFKDINNGIASGAGTYITSDGGDNWTKTSDDGGWGLDYGLGDTYFKTTQTKATKTSDNGQSWFGLKNDMNALFGTISFYDNDHGLLGDAGKVWLSDNGGFAWTEYTSPGIGVNRAAVRLDYDSAYICGEDGLIYMTGDHGANWTLEVDFSDYVFRDMNVNNDNTAIFACGFQGFVAKRTFVAPEPDPAIGVDPTSLSFDSIPVQDTTTLQLTVTNTGGQTLVVDSITSDNEYFWTNQEAFDLGQGESLTFDVFFSALKAGLAEGNIYIHNNTTFTAHKKVPVSGYGYETVGVFENKTSNLNIYPNPASGLVNIETGESIVGKTIIQIYDIEGKLRLLKTKNVNSNNLQLDISALSDGLYIIKMQNNNKIYRNRLMIK